jgi:hypothetical protein
VESALGQSLLFRACASRSGEIVLFSKADVNVGNVPSAVMGGGRDRID